MLPRALFISSSLTYLTLLLLSSNVIFAHTAVWQPALCQTALSDDIPYSTRAYWMRAANAALSTPCPFAAFGTVIVNHTGSTADDLGQLVCAGANENSETGNPAMHGEITAISICSAFLTDIAGPYKLTPMEALSAFKHFSLYTNAESCPMCASAIRWGGFKEYIFGTSIETLILKGWGQIHISSEEVFKKSFDLPTRTILIGEVLTNETDPLFSWQYDTSYPCPKGCVRSKSGESCLES